MGGIIVIVFLVAMLIFSFGELGNNPDGAFFWIVVCISALSWIGYQIYKSSLTDSYQVKDSKKDNENYRMELWNLKNRYKTGPFGDMGSPSKKTGQFSDGYRNAYKALNEKYGKPGSDTFERVRAKEKAYDLGIRDKQQLEEIGDKAVEKRREEVNLYFKNLGGE